MCIRHYRLVKGFSVQSLTVLWSAELLVPFGIRADKRETARAKTATAAVAPAVVVMVMAVVSATISTICELRLSSVSHLSTHLR